MFWIRSAAILIYLGSVRMLYDSDNEIVLDEGLDDIDSLCKTKICIRKCCGQKEFVVQENETTICEPFDTDDSESPFVNMFNVDLYDNYSHDVKVNKKLSDVFLLLPGKFSESSEEYENVTFAQEAFIGSDIGFNPYLSEVSKKHLYIKELRKRLNLSPLPNIDSAEKIQAVTRQLLLSKQNLQIDDGTLYLEFPNAYSRWTPINKSNYCVDIDDEFNPKFWSVLKSEVSDNNRYYTVGIIISSIFLMIVLLVYIALPELQNLAGLVLMAYVFSLGAAFIVLACLQLADMEPDMCIVLTGVCYFFFLSTFCWMSVMSYDIWWTFRGYAKARTINRRGEHFKFLMYCICAWGIPTAMTIGLIKINEMDLSKYPWIIKPQVPKFGCFLEGGNKFVYLYIPMLILIVCNWMFYLMTAFNIWRLVRGTAILNSTHRSQKNRLMVYVKLSVIMGINWLLEVVSFLTPNLPIWMYTDAYNVLIGFSIFLIFVWKRKIYRKLKARFTSSPLVHKFYQSSMSSTLESNLGQETSSISTNPKGFELKKV